MKMLTDRKEIAQALNFGKYPVLTWDLDENKGSKARVTKVSTRYGLMHYNCKLQKDYEKQGDGIFYLSKNATMLKGSYGVEDYLEDAEYANAPIIESNQEVAIFIHSKKCRVSMVLIVKAGKVSTDYSTATKFEAEF
jgi:hypothetical protein